MLKEIFEQSSTLRDCIRGRVVDNGRRIILNGVNDNKEKFRTCRRIVIVACGTSWHAGLLGRYLIQDMCRIPVVVEYASEFRYSNPVLTPDDVVIAISQSGETADTLAAIKIAKKQGAFVSVSATWWDRRYRARPISGCYIHVGPEIGVASTKAFTGQVMVLTLLALAVAQIRGTMSQEKISGTRSPGAQYPSLRRKSTRTRRAGEKAFANIYLCPQLLVSRSRLQLSGGARRGAQAEGRYPTYMPEGYPAAEMKHGPIALIDQEMPTVIIAPRDHLYDKIVSNVQQVKARGGNILAIVTEGDSTIRNIADHVLEVPEMPGMPHADHYLGAVAAVVILYRHQQGQGCRHAAKSCQICYGGVIMAVYIGPNAII